MKRLACAVVLAIGLSWSAGAATNVDAAFKAFWSAPTTAAAEKTTHAIVDSGVSFEDAVARLKGVRPNAAEKTGLIRKTTNVGGEDFETLIEIPEQYDPAKRWPLRVQLHGGVGRPPQPGRQPQSTRIPASEPQIYLEPQASDDNAWWHTSQVDSILGLLDAVKRKYNVDETQTYLTGISDGGTGTYFFALREPNPWSACLTLNGHPLVLANRDARIEGGLYLGNLANCPLYIENGDGDPLYPASSVTPIVEMMKRAGLAPVYRIMRNDKHDVHWWPEERGFYEMFVRSHPRAPHPERLSWETDRIDRFNRVRWLVIDKLAPRKATAPQEESINIFPRPRPIPSGRVDIERHGNAFEAATRGVGEFTLLLSADAIDFAKPVQVTVNGARLFNGAVKKDLATLLKWGARDNDRTALYGAELHITVP